MRVFRRDDLAEVNAWYYGHGLPTIAPSALPTLGLLQPGVAAGFLYETDSGVCLIEGYVTRPGCGPKARHAALEEITAQLLDCARDQGFKQAVAICRDSAIEKRAERHGFKPMGRFALYQKEL